MQKIYKYILDIEDKQDCRIKNFLKVLSVKEQNGEIVLYALTDDDYSDNILSIRIIGTGNDIENNVADYTFAGTVFMHNNAVLYSDHLVWHIFYKVQERQWINRHQLK